MEGNAKELLRFVVDVEVDLDDPWQATSKNEIRQEIVRGVASCHGVSKIEVRFEKPE